MALTNTVLLSHLAKARIPFTDNLATGGAASQAAALPVPTMASRFTYSAAGATASVVLKDILTNDCPDMYWVINDSGATIDVYPNGSQTINGGSSPLTIANAGFAFFSRIAANSDWRGAVFT